MPRCPMVNLKLKGFFSTHNTDGQYNANITQFEAYFTNIFQRYFAGSASTMPVLYPGYHNVASSTNMV